MIIQSGVEKEKIYSTEVLKRNLCNFNDSHAIVKGNTFVVKALVTVVAFI